MWFTHRPVKSVLLVIVRSAGVIVFYGLMRMVMVVPLRQMQP